MTLSRNKPSVTNFASEGGVTLETFTVCIANAGHVDIN